ncbi:MAG: kelch repeat-containing protein [Myxococcota bacterium]
MSHTTRLSFGPQVSIVLKRDSQRRLIAMRTYVDETPEGYHLETNPDKRDGSFITLPRSTQFGERYEDGTLHATGGPEGVEEELSMDYAAWIRRCVRQATAWARSTAINAAAQNFESGDYNLAADTYRDVLDHFPPPPDSPFLHWNYYLCIAELGHQEEASEGLEMWFAEALQIAGLDAGPKVLDPALRIMGEEKVRAQAEAWLPASSPHDPANKMTQRWLMRLGQGVPSRTRWEEHAPFPTPLKDVSYAVRSDGTVIATGGRTPDGYSTECAYVWQPDTQIWKPIAPMPEALHHHCLIPLSDGSVMCIGGQSIQKSGRLRHRKSVYSWSPSIDSWESLPELHIGREKHSGLVLNDGRVMVIGGESPLSLDANIELWDRRTCKWLKSTSTGAILKSPKLISYGSKVMIAGAGVPALGSAVLCLDSTTMRLSPHDDLRGVGLDGLYPLSSGTIAIWAYSNGECNIGIWNPEKSSINWNSSDLTISQRNDVAYITPCGSDHLLLLSMDQAGDTEARIIRPAKGLTDSIETVSGPARLEHLGVASLPDGRVLVSDQYNTLILST